jgi:hypothetical protein
MGRENQNIVDYMVSKQYPSITAPNVPRFCNVRLPRFEMLDARGKKKQSLGPFLRLGI